MGAVVTDANSLVTRILGNGDTRTFSPTSTYTRGDDTVTVYATATVTQQGGAARLAGVPGVVALVAAGLVAGSFAL